VSFLCGHVTGELTAVDARGNQAAAALPETELTTCSLFNDAKESGRCSPKSWSSPFEINGS